MSKIVDKDVKSILDKNHIDDFYDALEFLIRMGWNETLAFSTAMYFYDIEKSDKYFIVYLDIDEQAFKFRRLVDDTKHLIDYVKYCLDKGHEIIFGVEDKEIKIKDSSIYHYILEKLYKSNIDKESYDSNIYSDEEDVGDEYGANDYGGFDEADECDEYEDILTYDSDGNERTEPRRDEMGYYTENLSGDYEWG